MKRQWVYLMCAVAVTISLLIAGCAKPTPSPTPAPSPTPTATPAPSPTPAPEPIVWNLLAWQPKDNVMNKPTMIFIDMVNEALKGKFQVVFKGGPEVVAQADVYKTVVAGMVPIGFVSSGYFPDILTDAAMFSNLDHSELKKTGYYDMLDQLHQTKGLKFIGESNYTPANRYYFYTSFEVNRVEDFAGKKLRAFAITVPMVESTKGVPVTMGLGDVYTALERGTVDGAIMTPMGVISDYHWDEVTKYMIQPGAYTSIINVVANLDAWNKLPQDIRQTINDLFYQKFQPESQTYYTKMVDAEMQKIKASKMKIIELPPAEADKLSKLVVDAAWARLVKNNAELAAKLKPMLVK
ncbi:MAG: TRAP transporter substrate-binding protein DctP [Chloroflexi bacterium]|nr:TRAP transporter substrate-binding protein DctP [Chloroflexota bacterium]